MTAERVLEILDILEACGVAVAIDGGWGVDALVGRQTRPHDDLDLVVALGEVETIVAALEPSGFSIAEDERPVRLVVRGASGDQIDLHTVTFDAQGGGLQPQPGGGSFRYPPEGFVRGRLADREVRCISAPVQLLCHRGYPPGPKDVHDVLLLCRSFDLPLPPRYRDASPPAADAG